MSSKIVPFDLLIEGVLDQLKSKGYLESTLIVYRRIYARVRALLGQCNAEVYTPEIGEKFLAGTDVRKSTYAAYACAIRRLNDFINGKPFRSHHDCPHTQPSPEFSCILDEYLRKCMNNGNKAGTLQFKERTCALFLVYLDECLVALRVFAADKAAHHIFVQPLTDFRHEGVHPVYDRLPGQGDFLHHVIPGLPVKREPEDELSVEDVRDDGGGHRTFINQRIQVWDGEHVMFQANRYGRRVCDLRIIRRIQSHQHPMGMPVDDPPLSLTILLIQGIYVNVIDELPGQSVK